MNINLHIERLVLDGLNLGPGQGVRVKQAVEAELARLLLESGLADNLQSGGALPDVRAHPMPIGENADPSSLGKAIGRAVYGGIGK